MCECFPFTIDIVRSCLQANAQRFSALEFKVHSYRNALHRAIGNDGRCCDDDPSRDKFEPCINSCDNMFSFCLGDYDADYTMRGSAPPANCTKTGVLADDTDDFTFTVGEPFPKMPGDTDQDISNPVQLAISPGEVSTVIAYKIHGLASSNGFTCTALF